MKILQSIFQLESDLIIFIYFLKYDYGFVKIKIKKYNVHSVVFAEDPRAGDGVRRILHPSPERNVSLR